MPVIWICTRKGENQAFQGIVLSGGKLLSYKMQASGETEKQFFALIIFTGIEIMTFTISYHSVFYASPLETEISLEIHMINYGYA